MNKHGLGVEVIVDVNEETIPLRPSCPHGPMLLFERYTANGKNNGRRFFACSANRSRKLCNFFFWADELKNSSNDKARIENSNKTVLDYSRTEKLLRKSNEPRQFCKTCSLFLLPKECEMHKEHEVETNITDDLLLRPTKLLAPQKNNKQYAQFLFSEKTVSFIMKTLKNLGVRNALCIGTPRVHEQLMLSGYSSLLMDIDERYAQFNKCNNFVKYNMFNHHFFDSDTTAYREMLTKDSLCLLLDPPFGGLIDAIAHTVKQIVDSWKKAVLRADGAQPLVLWFFPYFIEKRIFQAYPSMQMLDFKIEYENHPSFSGESGGSRHGSPIRMFTNFDLKMFKPPDSDNYRYCEICQKYVLKGNVHCEKCRTCTSKDGRPYRHCTECERCVKSSWYHCSVCQQCVVQDHKCSIVPTPGACHICGVLGHKRKQCMKRYSKKRKKQRIC